MTIVELFLDFAHLLKAPAHHTFLLHRNVYQFTVSASHLTHAKSAHASPGRNQLASTSTTAPTTASNPASLKIKLDAMTLSDVISKTHPSDLASVLQSSLKTATPDEIRVLFKVFRPLLGRALIKRTCVRCNEEYIESQNGNSSCRVEHSAEAEAYIPDSEWVEDPNERPPEYVIYPCCERVVDVEEERWSAYTECYTAKHTTDPKEIDAYGYEARLEKKRARAKMS